jgi:hypothetical protein
MIQLEHKPFLISPELRESLRKLDEKSMKVTMAETMSGPDDPINPDHYKNHPSKVECIQITEHFNFCRGNAIKYLWRAGEKGDAIEDLKKARWYVDREIQRLERMREYDK